MNQTNLVQRTLLLVLVIGSWGHSVSQSLRIDPTYKPQLYQTGAVQRIELLAGDKLLVWGDFMKSGTDLVNGLARLTNTGAYDPTFQLDPSLSETKITSCVLVSQQKILITTENNQIFRLMPDGGLDTGFQSPVFDGPISQLSETSTGTYMVAGYFTQVDGQPGQKLVRLLANGTRDTSFGAIPSAVQRLDYVLPTPGGELLLMGVMETSAGVFVPVIRLSQNGSLDPGFTFTDGTGTVPAAFLLFIRKGVLLPNGSMAIVGQNFISSTQPGLYLRVTSAGAVQTYLTAPGPLDALTITEGAQPQVYVAGSSVSPRYENGGILLAVSATSGIQDLEVRNNQLYVGGYFSEYSGVNTRGVARQAVGGPVDTTFKTVILKPARLYSMDLWQNKVITGGELNRFGQDDIENTMIILAPDGSLDTQYSFNANRPVLIQTLPDTTFLVVDYVGDGSINRRMIRVRPNGSFSYLGQLLPTVMVRDATPLNASQLLLTGRFSAIAPPVSNAGLLQYISGGFNTSFSSQGFWNGQTTAQILPDGNILMGTGNTEYQNITSSSLVRLKPDLTVDNSFSRPEPLNNGPATANVSSLTIQPDGKILVAGDFTLLGTQPISPRLARFMPNGVLDTSWHVAGGFALNGVPERAIIRRVICIDSLICVAGTFNQYQGQPTMRGFAVLRQDASLDLRFAKNDLLSGEVWDMVPSEDSLFVWISGDFWVRGPEGHTSLARINLQNLTINDSLGSDHGILLYPNPVADLLYMKLNRPLTSTSTWQILDTQGRRILSGSLAAGSTLSEIQLGDLPNGVYMIQLTQPEGVFAKSFIRRQ
ncbi:MAG: T9SS type A sorting domain-containing protein [Bacteroidia bacterium]|nr:T9SS type A sorting domain-containing protein [Bacteroidia bacterium]